jgi:uncharacterized protein (TIGR02265 family)
VNLPRKLHVTSATSLNHSYNLEARLASCNPDDTLKGMFFQRMVDAAKVVNVQGRTLGLQCPLDDHAYVAFRDYPVADYFRWASAVARASYPNLPAPEALRRVGRQDFTKFADSRLGRVMLAFTGGAKGTLAKADTMYSNVLRGPKVSVVESSAGVTIKFRGYHGPVEVYPIGTIESTCLHYGVGCTIDIDVHSPADADYHVSIRE